MTLVERLRAEETFTSQPQLLLIREAADELERVQQRVEVLEGALRRIAETDEELPFLDQACAMRKEARAALGR